MKKVQKIVVFFWMIYFFSPAFSLAVHPLIQAMDAYEHPKYLDADEQLLVDAIKKYGPNVIVDTMKARLLHYAVSNEYYKTVQILLAQGACVNVQDGSGNIPLHDAVFLHNVALVTLLLNHGADPLFANRYEVTPLNLASEDQKIYELLLRKIEKISASL